MLKKNLLGRKIQQNQLAQLKISKKSSSRMSKLQDMSRSVDSVPIPQINMKKPMTAASPYNRITAETTIMPNIYSSEFLEKDGRHT